MKCKKCGNEKMYQPGGQNIEWACSWCGHFEWYEGKEPPKEISVYDLGNGGIAILNGVLKEKDRQISELERLLEEGVDLVNLNGTYSSTKQHDWTIDVNKYLQKEGGKK